MRRKEGVEMATSNPETAQEPQRILIRTEVEGRIKQLRAVIELLYAADSTRTIDGVATTPTALTTRAADLLRPLVTAMVVKGDFHMMQMILLCSDRSVDEVEEVLRLLAPLAQRAIDETTRTLQRREYLRTPG
jgi:hypothetical protein